MSDIETEGVRKCVVGGVDTHKDLHVAAVVDDLDRVLASACFATTRHGYKQMLAWMRSFGELTRVGIECTGTYGAGLLRYLEHAKISVLEVTAPDRSDRRKRGKDDTLDACNAAHAAFAGIRQSHPRSETGWSSRCASSKFAAKQRSRLVASHCNLSRTPSSAHQMSFVSIYAV